MGNETRSDTKRIVISSYEDVIVARQNIREAMQAMGFSLLDQTRIVTAVSELARNIVVHAGRGEMVATHLRRAGSVGIKLVFADKGPGIADLGRAMQDGYSTTNSLGLGLSGSKRLCQSFEIDSAPGKGTTITITEWKK